MKKLIIILICPLFIHFGHTKSLSEIHKDIIGKDSVESFNKKFPQIVKDKYVYIAYLQSKYKHLKLVDLNNSKIYEIN